MKQAQKGFTLIELMIVIAIVGILAAVALPAYQDYTVRAKLSEVIARGAEAKTSVAEWYAAKGNLPSNANSAPFNTGSAGKVALVSWKPGNAGTAAIVLEVSATGIPEVGGNNKLSILVASTANGVITWTCGDRTDTTIVSKYLPGSCK